MAIVNRMFLDHPASVDETYIEHLSAASGFGGRMILAGVACIIHGLIPGLFTHAASDQIRALCQEMESRRVTRSTVDVGAGALGRG